MTSVVDVGRRGQEPHHDPQGRSNGAVHRASRTGNTVADQAIYKTVAEDQPVRSTRPSRRSLDVQRVLVQHPGLAGERRVQAAWTNAVTRVLAGQQTPKQALDQAQKEAVAAIKAATSSTSVRRRRGSARRRVHQRRALSRGPGTGSPGSGERDTWAAYAFLSPWLFGFVVFTAGPMIASLILSFTDYSVIQTTHNVGLRELPHALPRPVRAHGAAEHVRLHAMYRAART